jgi:hypothetical protein
MRHIHKGYGSHFWYADGSDDDECGMWHIHYIILSLVFILLYKSLGT